MDDALKSIIRDYTKESGVRNLERTIATVLRKIATILVREKDLPAGRQGKIKVAKADLLEYLGAPKYRYGLAEEADQVGTATGLVWTEVGGDTIPIEVTIMKGRGSLTLTGQLGDVMQESAKAALSYVRSRAEELGLDENFYRKFDIHIHVPEGAVPKDGPSAGITIATALTSALCGIPVRRDLAMTGEITLRGKVLPIGGLKEKILGARRSGIFEVILPDDNRKDIEELKKEVPADMKMNFVKEMDEVLKLALTRDPIKPGKSPRSPRPPLEGQMYA